MWLWQYDYMNPVDLTRKKTQLIQKFDVLYDLLINIWYFLISQKYLMEEIPWQKVVMSSTFLLSFQWGKIFFFTKMIEICFVVLFFVQWPVRDWLFVFNLSFKFFKLKCLFGGVFFYLLKLLFSNFKVLYPWSRVKWHCTRSFIDQLVLICICWLMFLESVWTSVMNNTRL